MGDKEKQTINQEQELTETVVEKVDEPEETILEETESEPEEAASEEKESELEETASNEEESEPEEAALEEEESEPEETASEEEESEPEETASEEEESEPEETASEEEESEPEETASEETENEPEEDERELEEYEESDEAIVISDEENLDEIAEEEASENQEEPVSEQVESASDQEEQKLPKAEKTKRRKRKKKAPETEDQKPKKTGKKKAKQPEIEKKPEKLSALEEAEEAWERNKKRKKIRNRILITILLLAAVYFGVGGFFHSHFLPYTKINGKLFPMKTVEQVEDHMRQQVDDYELTLVEKDGRKETITGKEIDLKYIPDEDVKKILENQNGWLWVKALWDHPDIDAPVGVEYNEKKLTDVLKKLRCVTQEQVAPVSAHPEFKEDRFEVVEETMGTQIDRERFDKTVTKAITGFVAEIDLMEEKCYVFPKFLKDSKEVSEAAEKMNSYLGASITLDFSPHTEVVDAKQIAQWVKVDDEMQVTFDQELVRGYVAELAQKYDTYGKARSFVTGYGNTVQVDGGSYGWQIDQEAEYNALVTNIQNAETVTREPNYARRAASHDGNDFGNTYAEVDLTKQHFFFFQNGQCVMQCDVVTGNPQQKNGTPQGVYSLAYKAQNQTLRGPKKPDGTYEWESPVKFWMPFNGGIGFHDAPWRSAFGGAIYNGNGSHGCVNMPPASAAQLYPLITPGTPVVCHY